LEVNLESNELAHAVVEIATGKKAANILMLDMREVTLLADYYVLCDGSSGSRIKSSSNTKLAKARIVKGSLVFR
jgi:ribosome-associated protein